MPSSYETFNGDGSTTDFTFTFDFISSSHVGVEVDGVATSAFSFIGTKQVRMDSAPASGTGNVVIRRTTPTAPLTDFVSGSTLSEGDLDRALLQSLYVAEESKDSLATVISFNGTTFDADNKRISSLGSPVDAADAVSKEYVDGISVATGNVPTPLDPADDDKVLTAGSGGFTWEDVPEGLAAGSVGATELATNAVTSIKVQDAAITEAKLADNAVTLSKMEDGTAGDILYYGASGAPARLTAGAVGQSLVMGASYPEWGGAGIPTGSVTSYLGTTAPTGWLLLNGSSLAKTSGGTYNGADYQTLYELLWDSMADSEAAVAGGRGSSATDDWNANKALTMPDATGRTIFGKESSATRITSGETGVDGSVMGDSGGVEAHAISGSEMAAHSHSLTHYNPSGSSGAAANAGTSETGQGSGSSTSTSAGSNLTHTNLPPALILSWIVKV